MPVVLLALLGAIQTGIVLHARSVVDNAALTGAEIASVGGSQDAARRAARELASDAGLRNVDVRVSTASGLITVSVSARAQVIIDVGSSSAVAASAVMPAEVP